MISITALMMMALKPNMIISCFIKGKAFTASPVSVTCCRESNHLKKTNSKNEMLQIKANRDRNKITLTLFDLICSMFKKLERI